MTRDDVLRRSKFDPYVSEIQRLEFLASLIKQAETIDVVDVVTECRDPDDDKFLEQAVSGKATHVISGDADLLALHPFRGIAILSPQAFLEFQVCLITKSLVLSHRRSTVLQRFPPRTVRYKRFTLRWPIPQ